ncbi:MAG: S9 family peptidase, partial [Candidatus Bathyarchaeia archaeon]
MNIKRHFVSFFFIALFTSFTDEEKKNPALTPLSYPATKKVDVIDDYFGIKIADPYRWLEDDNSEETKQWVDEQNKVTFGYLEKIP